VFIPLRLLAQRADLASHVATDASSSLPLLPRRAPLARSSASTSAGNTLFADQGIFIL
jgi:hypothetical protein